jgi:hypothetical protein
MNAHQIKLDTCLLRMLLPVLLQAGNGGLVLALACLFDPILVGGGMQAGATCGQYQQGKGIQPEPAQKRGSGWKEADVLQSLSFY